MQLSDFLPPILTRPFARQQYKDLIGGSIGFYPDMASFLSNPSEPTYTSYRSYEKLAEHGYGRNPYLHRAIRLIAEGMAGIPLHLYKKATDSNGKKKREEIEGVPLLDLLNLSANEEQTAPELIEWFVSYWLLAGQAYLYALRPESGSNKAPVALYALQPNLVTPKVDRDGKLQYWLFDEGQGHRLEIAPEDLMRVRDFNPLNRSAGLAAAKVAARAVDQMNAANDWNTALQQNMMRPSGIISPDIKDGQTMPPDANDNFKQQLQDKYSGPANAGRPLVPRFPVKWQSMGNTAVEMDWLNGKIQAAREISIPLGIPPVLLNDPDNTTYNNLKEAKAAMYEEALLPRMDRLMPALGRFLLPMFGYDPRNYVIGYDRDEIEALQEDRDATHTRARNDYAGGLLTLNEAREDIGIDDAEENGDVFLVPRGAQTLDMLMEGAGLPIIPDGTQPPHNLPGQPPTPPQLPPGNIVDANPTNDGTPPNGNPSGKSAVMPPFPSKPNGVRIRNPRVRRRRQV